MANDVYHNPWRGPSSYEDPAYARDKACVFTGRDTETGILTATIRANLFVTLYGKTGIGKTSLLRAGVFPSLRKHGFIPIELRLDSESDIPYTHQIINAIDKRCADDGIKIRLHNGSADAHHDPDNPDALAYYFAGRHFIAGDNKQEVYPVLVFDQFEQTLHRSLPRAEQLMQALYTLVDNPPYFDAEQYHRDTNFRIVICLREDELYALEDIIDRLGIASLKDNRMRLGALSAAEARAVVLGPGAQFIAHDEAAVADHIIAQATDSSGNVDTLLLSLLCSLAYERAAARAAKHAKPRITPDIVDKDTSDDAIYDYYLNAIDGLGENIRRFIEHNLIDPSGHRDSVLATRIKNSRVRDRLTQGPNRLLQKVFMTSSAEPRYELIHDRVAMAALRSRNENRRRNGFINTTTLIILACIVAAALTAIHNFEADDISGRHLTALHQPDRLTMHVKDDEDVEMLVGIKRLVLHNDSTDTDRHNVKVTNCPNLSDITLVGNYDPDRRIVTEKTPALRSITVCDSLHYLVLDLQTQHRVTLHLNARVDHLSFHDNTRVGDIFIDTIANPHLRWIDDILWDIDKDEIVYTDRFTNMVHQLFVSFPSSIDTLNTQYKGRVIKKANTEGTFSVMQGDETLSSAYFSPQSQDVNIENTKYRYIAPKAFAYNRHLRSIKLPAKLKKISDEAFAHCSSLTELVIPNSVHRIGANAFRGCNALRRLVLPDSLTTFFAPDLPSLRTVEIADYYDRWMNFEWTNTDSIDFIIKGHPDGIGDKIEIHDNIVFAEGLPQIFGRCDYYTYNAPDSSYISYAGVLFKRFSKRYFSVVRVPKDADIDKLRTNIHNGIHYYTNDMVYDADKGHIARVRYLQPHSTTITCCNTQNITEAHFPNIIPPNAVFDDANRSILELKFTSRPDSLREIHIPYPHPYVVDKRGNRIGLRIDLPDDIKSRVTLYVPWGCLQNFITHQEYLDFADIQEDSYIARIGDHLTSALFHSTDYLNIYPWLRYLLFAVVIAAATGIFIMVKRMTMRHRRLSQLKLRDFINISFIAITVVPSVIVVYASVFYVMSRYFLDTLSYTNNSLAWLISTVTAAGATVAVAYLMYRQLRRR